MDSNINYKDLNNIGGFKTSITKQTNTTLDSNSFHKLNSLINNLTDTLFLPLSRGIRMPALAVGKLCYDETTDSWMVKNVPFNNVYFLQGITLIKSGGYLQFLDVTINPDIVSKSDTSGFYLVHNASDYTSGMAAVDQSLFPRVDSILNDNTVRIALEGAQDVEWNYFYEGSYNGIPGMCLFLEGIFQSDAEHADRDFYIPGIPYFVLNTLTSYLNSVTITGYVYNDLYPDITGISWDSKIKVRGQVWSGDCTSGSGSGDYTYTNFETVYKTTEHKVVLTNLAPDTKYKLWVEIDSKLGPDNFEWATIGCITTKPIGDIGGRAPTLG